MFPVFVNIWLIIFSGDVIALIPVIFPGLLMVHVYCVSAGMVLFAFVVGSYVNGVPL